VGGENNSKPGESVYDPFVGSGTTIIAAEMTGRACHAIEIDPVYVDVAIAALAELHRAAGGNP
jgi:DNA modification methylase